MILEINGWGTWIRTRECRYQKPVPYRLAIPQKIAKRTLLAPYSLSISFSQYVMRMVTTFFHQTGVKKSNIVQFIVRQIVLWG